MQLREIHVDAFGIFCDKHATGISSGINVIYGPNEFGKSTLLTFIRRILFGFPDKRYKGNLYPPLGGGAYGGRLVCQLANGKAITISRGEGRSGGSLSIHLNSKELSGQDELDKLLSNIGEVFYRNVYAISLDELEQSGLLENDEEVRRSIYGAGLGLGTISLKTVRDEFAAKATAVFKSGGSVQKIPETYKAITELEHDIRRTKEGLSKYDELVSERDGLVEEVNSLGAQVHILEKKQRELEDQKNLFPVFAELTRAKILLSELHDVPLFTKDALSKLEKLKAGVSSVSDLINAENEELRRLEFQRDQLVYDAQIVEGEPNIASLQKKSDKFVSATKDIEQVESERTGLADDIETEIRGIAGGWTEQNIQDFDLNLCQEDAIRTFKRDLEIARGNIDKIKTKQESLRDKKAAEASTNFTMPAALRYAIYLLTTLGLVGAIAGFRVSQMLWAALSCIMLVMGVALIVYYRKKPGGVLPPDPLDKKYGEDLLDAESTFNEVRDRWHAFLRSIEFDESLSPDGALDMVRSIRELKSKIRTRDRLDSRIVRMKEDIKSAKDLHDQIVANLNKSKLSNDIAANIEILPKLLDMAKETKRDKQGFERQINGKKQKLKGMERQRNSEGEKLQDYISSLGAKDETDFKNKYETFVKVEEQRGIVNKSKEIIEQRIGIGRQYDTFIESISSASPSEIDSKLQEMENQLTELRQKLDTDKETIGEKRNEIQQLASSEVLLEDKCKLESEKEQLNGYARDWVVAQIALFVLEKAISKYENTRQPEVIKATQNIFANITGHAYPVIIKSAETNEIKIQDAARRSKRVVEMSRGTREQLYFAMRLGLITVYEAEREPMPIVMDDILVNFDDDRGPSAIKELVKFAEDRQIIILTCHNNTLHLYRSVGAKEITFD
jgi:uncharacterized protein YhaN